MVILIAGASYVGKTLMAQRLLETYKIPYISIDHIKMGMYRSGIDFGFTPESEREIVTEKLWSVIKGIIMTNIENCQNIIIEGCYFPENLNISDKKYLENIILLYMIFSERYIKKSFTKGIYENRNIVENRLCEMENKNDFVERYIDENKRNKEYCIKNNVQYFEIVEDYAEEIKSVYEWIEKKIRQ